ncbi:MarR family winged helix-turn-helix transcriptional regulator [Leucothrix pacifica]|uniref:MarR family transcriptional regulator n=1 Tax=Leucothrix pacifica TaxID=1247513 RepID=A0A317CLL1_9GAMM|nr:MarR family winged helix-turn-helix transcriptional regulator [Leucothrix pacifica]PWQ99406.1 MarR family transcriptional regulator [Leucothrix pacifica]
MTLEDQSNPDVIPLDDFLTYRLNVLSNLLNKQTVRFLKDEHGIAIPDWRVLLLLVQGGPMSIRDLASLSRADKALISRVVSRLIDLGLVVRKTNDYDARLVQVSITEKGRDVFNNIQPRARVRQQVLRSILEPDELEVLDRALTKLTDFVDEKGDDLF